METLPDRLVEAEPVTSPVREMVLLADNFFRAGSNASGGSGASIIVGMDLAAASVMP